MRNKVCAVLRNVGCVLLLGSGMLMASGAQAVSKVGSCGACRTDVAKHHCFGSGGSSDKSFCYKKCLLLSYKHVTPRCVNPVQGYRDCVRRTNNAQGCHDAIAKVMPGRHVSGGFVSCSNCKMDGKTHFCEGSGGGSDRSFCRKHCLLDTYKNSKGVHTYAHCNDAAASLAFCKKFARDASKCAGMVQNALELSAHGQ